MRNKALLASLLSLLVSLVPQAHPTRAQAGRALDAAKPREQQLDPPAKWEVVYTLEGNAKKRWFDGLWAADTGDLFAVGRGVIVRCPATRDCRSEVIPLEQHPTTAWGTSPTNVWAVGFLGLILHYDGVRWTVENQMSPKARLRKDSLFEVGPYLPGMIVAGSHSQGSLKRADGAWLPLVEEDFPRLTHWKEPKGRGPCTSFGVDMWLNDHQRNQLWVVCQNMSMYRQEGNTWRPEPRPPRAWTRHVTNVFWKGDIFLSTERGLWTNEGGRWHQEAVPGVVREVSANATALYAVTLQSILRRTR